MQNIIIVTIYDISNYGNRLQNLATTILLEGMGFEVVTIDYVDRDYYSWKSRIKRVFHSMTNYKFTKDANYYMYQLPRELNNEKTDKRNIKKIYISNVSDIPEADYYLLGSDQVWTPTWYEDYKIKKDLFFLTFADPDKRAFFAPSFGVEVHFGVRPH